MLSCLRTLLDAHSAVADDARRQCVEECLECAAVCIACADACLSEGENVELKRCIRLNLDCASICRATGDITLRQCETDLEILKAQLQSCTLACKHCRIECEKNTPEREYCEACAGACRRCEEACSALLRELGSSGLERPEHYSG